jgi:hypothetical protein
MRKFEGAWTEHQAQRWILPNAENWMRPDWRRWVNLGGGQPTLVEKKLFAMSVLGLSPTRAQPNSCNFDLISAAPGLGAFVDLEDKAGFRRDQPRWPSGSGDISGRWSGGAGTPSELQGIPTPKVRGHHFVDRALFDNPKLRLSDEAREVFRRAVTGPLNAGPHRWSREHAIYNDAVEQLFKRYTSENGILSEQMTADQARKFVDEVKQSRDPRIRSFNMRIYMREIMYWTRRSPRGHE